MKIKNKEEVEGNEEINFLNLVLKNFNPLCVVYREINFLFLFLN